MNLQNENKTKTKQFCILAHQQFSLQVIHSRCKRKGSKKSDALCIWHLFNEAHFKQKKKCTHKKTVSLHSTQFPLGLMSRSSVKLHVLNYSLSWVRIICAAHNMAKHVFCDLSTKRRRFSNESTIKFKKDPKYCLCRTLSKTLSCFFLVSFFFS